MARTFTTLVKSLLAATGVPALIIGVEFRDLGLKLTNWPRDFTADGRTYTGGRGDHPFTLELDGLSESLEWDAPTAVLKIESLDGYFTSLFFSDSFREDQVTVRVFYLDGSTPTATGWVSTYTCDMDEADAQHVSLRLAAADAVLGTEIPRRTTQEGGCQHDFQRGMCSYRWAAGASTALKRCDHGYDTPNGCKAHFPDLCLEHQTAWNASVCPGLGHTRVVQPKPYGGFLGSVDQTIVRR